MSCNGQFFSQLYESVEMFKPPNVSKLNVIGERHNAQLQRTKKRYPLIPVVQKCFIQMSLCYLLWVICEALGKLGIIFWNLKWLHPVSALHPWHLLMSVWFEAGIDQRTQCCHTFEFGWKSWSVVDSLKKIVCVIIYLLYPRRAIPKVRWLKCTLVLLSLQPLALQAWGS